MTADVAALPEAKATAYWACSTGAIARSNAPRVGFPVREYSYPLPKLLGSFGLTGIPGIDCWNVVATLIGTTIAPDGLLLRFSRSVSTTVVMLVSLLYVTVCKYAVPQPRYGSAKNNDDTKEKGVVW